MNRKQRRELARQTVKGKDERKALAQALKDMPETPAEPEEQPTFHDQIKRRRESGLYVVRRRPLSGA